MTRTTKLTGGELCFLEQTKTSFGYSVSLAMNKFSFSPSAASLMSTAAYWGMTAVAAPMIPCEPPPPPLPAQPPQPPLPPAPPACDPPPAKALITDKSKKAKKDKASFGTCGGKARGNLLCMVFDFRVYLCSQRRARSKCLRL